MIKGRLVAAGLAIAIAATAPASRAHQADPGVVAVLDAVEPPLPGVTVEVRPSAVDQLLVSNPTPTVLTILGVEGEPFLRIGPGGAYANLGSPSWPRSNSPGGGGGGSGPERFVRVAREPAWGWFDHRMHADDVALDPALRQGRNVVRLSEWRVPFRYGDRAGEFRGHVEFRPVLGAFRTAVRSLPPGVTADVLQGRVPGLFLRYAGAGPLVVLGAAREPFARLAPAATEVNLASPTYVEDLTLRGLTPTVAADATAEPRWQRVATAPALTWLDRRLTGQEGTSAGWRIPLRLGATEAAIEGVTEWVPRDRSARGGSRLPWLLGAIVVVAVAVGARSHYARSG